MDTTLNNNPTVIALAVAQTAWVKSDDADMVVCTALADGDLPVFVFTRSDIADLYVELLADQPLPRRCGIDERRDWLLAMTTMRRLVEFAAITITDLQGAASCAA